jgi:transposase InsO family protein
MAWVWPLKSLSIPETLAILKRFFEEHFVPDILQSDNGPQFKNKLLAAVCKELNFKQRFGASETPEHQGQIERFNKTFKTNLFRWVQQVDESTACNEWPTTGLAYVMKQYRCTLHSTINTSPDMFVYGTMRTPDDRESHKQLTRSLISLIDDVPPNRLTSNMFDHYEETLARCVWAYLELRDSTARKAMSSTERTQIANRTRRSGIRLSKSILPQIGQTVLMRRPIKRPNAYAAKDPTKSVNVKGVVIAVSLVAASFKVQWVDDSTHEVRETWTGAQGLVFSDDVCVARQPQTLTTTDIGLHMKDFINDVQNWWRDTKATLEEVRNDEEDMCSRSIENALSSLGLDQWELRMTKEQFAEEVLQSVLDEKFIRYLRVCEPAVANLEGDVDDQDINELLNHSIKNLGYTQLMAAAGRWRKDRALKPELLFPKVLQALSGTPHECSSCALTKKCQAEHACCRAWVLAKIDQMGWSQISPAIQVEHVVCSH